MEIVFIQEIRDKSGEVFEELCENLEDYDCEVSSRAGRTNSKEQYGLIYKNSFEVDIKDYNLDENSNDFWERPPLRADFTIDNYEFTVYNIHIKPNDVENELEYLEQLVETENNLDNVILLGDFNADGSYYDEDNKEIFLEHEWVIDDSIDTTVAKSDNTYDRIIMNEQMYEDYESKGVYKEVSKEVSDHYLVWVQVKTLD